MNTGIYCIKNKVNGKLYIGQSSDLKSRLRQHRTDLKCNRHHNKHLQSSFNKYKAENFEILVLEKCPIESLDARECYYIKKYNSHMRIYGFNKQVEGLVNKKPTDEARMNISKTSARYWLGKKRVVTWKPHAWTKEERKAMSDLAKGRTHTEQTKAKLSEISKANPSGRIAAIEASKKKIINEKLGIVYESVNDACKKLQISTSTVYRCVNGITKNKYRLKYA